MRFYSISTTFGRSCYTWQCAFSYPHGIELAGMNACKWNKLHTLEPRGMHKSMPRTFRQRIGETFLWGNWRSDRRIMVASVSSFCSTKNRKNINRNGVGFFFSWLKSIYTFCCHWMSRNPLCYSSHGLLTRKIALKRPEAAAVVLCVTNTSVEFVKWLFQIISKIPIGKLLEKKFQREQDESQ